MPVATETQLSSALRISVMRLSRRLRQQRSTELGLTATQLAALATLDRHGPLTPGELAAHEKVSAPSMTRVIAALADMNLVERRSHPKDGRQVLVELSDNGKTRLREDRRRREEWLAERLRDLTDDEQALLRQIVPLLDRLAES